MPVNKLYIEHGRRILLKYISKLSAIKCIILSVCNSDLNVDDFTDRYYVFGCTINKNNCYYVFGCTINKNNCIV